MNQEELNKALYEKMSAEQERYKHNLLGQTPEEVLNHAYEYAMREDILIEMETLDLPTPQAAALLASPFPLADVYKDFRDMETGHMDNVRECIEQRADDLLAVQWEKTRSIPLYQQSGAYAREHGELDAYRTSRQTNIVCKNTIEQAIREGYNGRSLDPDMARRVVAEFGPERVAYVLAATIQSKSWDERFSRINKAWALDVPMLEAEDRRSAYVVNSHSAILDVFVNQARKQMGIAHDVAALVSGKTSIKVQLAAKPVPGDHPTKPKEQEVMI